MVQLREGEKIIAIYRRHIIVLVSELAAIVLFSLFIIAGAISSGAFIPAEFSALYPLILFLAVLFLHLFWIAAFIILADFFLDVWILTDQRVIAVEQKSLFSRVVSECSLSKIQDTSIEVSGFIPTILHYGNLTVRTASEHQDFIFKQVARPNFVSEEIARTAKEFGAAEKLKQVL
ncbi:MAG: hypothetical protein A3A30_02445 [Candidatus Terrybacteria bacterium RIFCSPLOWO2_01_FULL_48_14]|nr:MAG: hypothetical protein A3A30_02445 [Candidatus Terrybacteria bacterium RIFCSPLOWO2_01_FULL_48_14]